MFHVEHARSGPPPKNRLTPGFWRRRASSSSTTIYPRYVNSNEFFLDHMGSLLFVSRNIFVLTPPLFWRRRADYSSSSTICQGFFSHREKIFQKRSLLRRANYTVVARRCQEKFAPSVKKNFWRSLSAGLPLPHPGIIQPKGCACQEKFCRLRGRFCDFFTLIATITRENMRKIYTNLG